MKIDITSVDEITIAKCIGPFDSTVAATVRQKLSPIAKKGGKLILDLTEVEYTSSAGLQMIHSTYRDIANNVGKMVLVNPQDSVMRVLETGGVPRVIPIFNDLESAIAELKK